MILPATVKAWVEVFLSFVAVTLNEESLFEELYNLKQSAKIKI